MPVGVPPPWGSVLSWVPFVLDAFSKVSDKVNWRGYFSLFQLYDVHGLLAAKRLPLVAEPLCLYPLFGGWSRPSAFPAEGHPTLEGVLTLLGFSGSVLRIALLSPRLNCYLSIN